MDSYREIADYIRSREKVYLFGAGRVAARLCRLLRNEGIDIAGFLVSDKQDNPDDIEGNPVIALSDIDGMGIAADEMLVVVAIMIPKKNPLLDDLVSYGFKGIVFLNDKCITDIYREEYRHLFDDSTEYALDIDSPGIEWNRGYLLDNNDDRPLFRIFLRNKPEQTMDSISLCCRESYERDFGSLRLVPRCEKADIRKESIIGRRVEIFVMTGHLNTTQARPHYTPGRILLQVGAALTDDRMGVLTDDSGDNISDRNRDYSECSGLYWIWKNTSGQDYIGLEHYRRKMNIYDAHIAWLYDEGIEAVFSIPQFDLYPMKELFVERQKNMSKYDWEHMRQAVIAQDASFETVMDRYEKSHFYLPCNIFLMKRKWFDRYCEFAFNVTFSMEEESERRGIIRRNRYMGFVFENLMSIFAMRYAPEMKVAYTDLYFQDVK